MSYEELPHTADIKIRARAPNREGLFAEAFRALMDAMYGTDRKGGTARTVDIEAPDDESLLFDFLSESLYLTEVDGLVFEKADVTLDNHKLHAVLSGEPFDPARHSGGTEVKGISYSGMEIREDAAGYILDIIFDV